MSNLPVELRHEIVYPAIVHPHQHVCIKVVVVLQAIGLAANRRILFVAVYTERRNAELHPRLGGAYRFVQLLNEQVHIISAPVTNVFHSVAVSSELSAVIYRLTGNRIRIKVIVYVESVYIISANNVLHHAADIVTALRDAWIHDELTVIRKHPLWMAYRHMVARKRFRGLCLCSIRVYPCMQFHSALVALLHHPCKRIPVWRWC